MIVPRFGLLLPFLLSYGGAWAYTTRLRVLRVVSGPRSWHGVLARHDTVEDLVFPRRAYSCSV
jgi:hypothetical protein